MIRAACMAMSLPQVHVARTADPASGEPEGRVGWSGTFDIGLPAGSLRNEPDHPPDGSEDSVHPAERVVGAAVLDVDEGLADLHGQRAGLGRALDLAALPLQGADRG